MGKHLRGFWLIHCWGITEAWLTLAAKQTKELWLTASPAHGFVPLLTGRVHLSSRSRQQNAYFGNSYHS